MDRARSSKSPNGSLGGGFHISLGGGFHIADEGRAPGQIPAADRMPPTHHSMIRKATAGSCRRSPQESRTHQRHRYHGHSGSRRTTQGDRGVEHLPPEPHWRITSRPHGGGFPL